MAKSEQKNLLWDLGNTLITADTYSYARAVGLTDFVLYPLLEWKNPKKIYELLFEILSHVDVPRHNAYPEATTGGKTLPSIMCHWLAGSMPHDEIKKNIEASLKKCSSHGGFTSARQERLIRQIIRVMFDPTTFAHCMRPINAGVALLHECLQQQDFINPRHAFYIVSNWDAESFKALKAEPAHEPIFRHFDEQNILISGHAGVIKPQRALYEHFLNKHNLEPSTCILIDDQTENIAAAQRCGMIGILVNQGNYDEVKKQLQKLHVLS